MRIPDRKYLFQFNSKEVFDFLKDKIKRYIICLDSGYYYIVRDNINFKELIERNNSHIMYLEYEKWAKYLKDYDAPQPTIRKFTNMDLINVNLSRPFLVVPEDVYCTLNFLYKL